MQNELPDLGGNAPVCDQLRVSGRKGASAIHNMTGVYGEPTPFGWHFCEGLYNEIDVDERSHVFALR